MEKIRGIGFEPRPGDADVIISPRRDQCAVRRMAPIEIQWKVAWTLVTLIAAHASLEKDWRVQSE